MVPPAAAVATTRSASDSILRSRREEWFRLQRLSRQRSSASESNFRRCKEEWPACRGRRGNDLSHLILIFVAAKKNGSPAVHPQRQPKSRLRLVRCCSDSGFHGVNLGITAEISPEIAPALQRFLISWGKLGNHCRESPRFGPGAAAIPDFRGSI